MRVNQDITSRFPTKTGFKQGFFPLQLLSILPKLVLGLAIKDEQIGAAVNEQIINNLGYADNIVLLAENEKDLQTLVSKEDTFSTKLGLTVKTRKSRYIQVICREKFKTVIKIDGN